MNETLKYIPGFRTKTKWKMIVASIYYLFSLLCIIGGINACLLMLSIPFFMLNLVDTFTKRSKDAFTIALVALIVMYVAVRIG